MNQKTISNRAWAELLLLGLIWGASFLAVKITLREVPFVTVVLHRTFWASLVLWSIVIALRLPLPRDARTLGAFVVMGLLNNVIPFGLLTWGQQYIESGLTSILNATTAIFGVLVAAIVFADERLTLRKAVGVGLGFAGVATAVGPGALDAFDLRSGAQIAVLGATFAYACASAWARAKLGGLHPLVAAAGMLTASTLILAPAAWIVDGPVNLALSPASWMAIGYISIVATALAFLLYYRVLGMAGSGNLMLVTLIVPPVAIALGALVLDETLSPRAYAGFALLGLGLLVLNGRLRWPLKRRIDPVAPAD